MFTQSLVKVIVALATSLLALTSFASAQSIVGTWSSRVLDPYGNTSAVIFLTFGSDGSFQEYLTTNMGASTYYGSYQVDASQTSVSYVLQDYDPKEFCSLGQCSPIPSFIPLGQTQGMQVQWMDNNLFVVQDAGGLMRYIRNQ
jgi:hypothetical protein